MDALFSWTYCRESATALDRSLGCFLSQRSSNRCQRCWLSVLSDYSDPYRLHKTGAVDLRTHCRLCSPTANGSICPSGVERGKDRCTWVRVKADAYLPETRTCFVVQRSCGTRVRNFCFPCQGFSLNVCAAIADANSLPKAEASSMFARDTTNWPGSAG